MKNNKITNVLLNCRKYIKSHSPEILTGVGVSGMFVSIALSIKGTIKAVKIIEEKKKTKELSKKDIFKETWKCYVPTGITCLTSMACIIGASSVNMKRNAALTTAYSLSESALKLYQDKVIETIGEKEEKKVRDVIAKEQINRKPMVSKEVIITEKGNTLCFDSLSGRYFKSDIETLRKAENEINKKLLNEMYVSLNDFYNEIGLEPNDTGDILGWNVEQKLIELSFSSQLAKDGTPCLVIDYVRRPTYEFNK